MSALFGELRVSVRNVALLSCSFVGLGVSIYLTLAHFSKAVTLVCSNSGAIDCEKVTTSPQSVIFGVPVAVLGLFYFVPMLALSLPGIYQRADKRIAAIRLALSVIGMGLVLYLLYAELFLIHAICLWCSSVHLLTFVIFCLVVSGWAEVNDSEFLEDDG